jgi:acyl-CoA dehydrogenase
MNLEFSAEDLAFQQQVRSFLDANLPAPIRDAVARQTGVFVDKDIAVAWQRILAAKGWAVPGWPEEWGGVRWSVTQRYIFTMECNKAGAPLLVPLGIGMLAPVLIAFGSEEQKRKYLPPMLSGEHYWCQGYSEPGSGSDLASLALKAERHDGHYLLNGSKLWTTHGHFADHIFCLVRTSSAGKPQQGISFLLVDMDTPGITVRPIITMALDHEVNQVFFDNVRVPLENLVGEEGKGWSYAKYLLEFERGGGMSAYLRLHELEQLRDIITTMRQQDGTFDADRRIRRQIARIEIDIKALEMTELRVLNTLAAGGSPGAESSILKISTVDIEQRIQQLALDAIGYHALPFAPARKTVADQAIFGPRHAATVVAKYLNGRAASIFGGSHEVQRNIIAKAALGL